MRKLSPFQGTAVKQMYKAQQHGVLDERL